MFLQLVRREQALTLLRKSIPLSRNYATQVQRHPASRGSASVEADRWSAKRSNGPATKADRGASTQNRQGRDSNRNTGQSRRRQGNDSKRPDFEGHKTFSKITSNKGQASQNSVPKEFKKPARPENKVRQLKAQEVAIPLPPFITVSDLAKTLNIKMRSLQVKMDQSGYPDTRADYMLSYADAEVLSLEFDITATPLSTSSDNFDIFPRPPPSDPSKLPLRPPVVTIMGHVDHGKTTLLDKLRSASVAAGEAGGITQHVGAFSVEVKGLSKSSGLNAITFIDTPGHAAFTQMRSRGAKVTDIVVLVVAADDGVMPQTKEVLRMVRDVQEEEGGKDAATGGLQLLVALSKVDKPEANVDRVKSQLLAEGVQLEDFGGEIPCIEISGKTGQGLDKLEENLVAISELNELRAEKDGPVEGYVIESRVEKGHGNTAVVLVKRGTLRIGDYFVAGTNWCKVRRLLDSSGKVSRKQSVPGDAALITGWRTLPKAGDLVLGVESVDGHNAEELVKKCIDTRTRIEERRKLLEDVDMINRTRRDEAMERERAERAAYEERKRRREARLRGEDVSSVIPPVEEKRLGDAEASKEMHELRLIVKADYTGTVEAVVGAISGIGNNEVRVKIINSGVGEPTESDLARAQAVQGHILAFNVKAHRSLENAAAKLEPAVKIHCDDVIYRLMSYVSEQCAALLPPIVEARIVGEAVVQQVFSINVRSRSFRNVAGCRVANGTISRHQMVRVLRPQDDKDGDGKPSRKLLYEGRIDSLKHVKKEVDEMRKGTECGMAFADNFQDLQQGDLIQSFYREEVPRTL